MSEHKMFGHFLCIPCLFWCQSQNCSVVKGFLKESGNCLLDLCTLLEAINMCLLFVKI